MEKAYLSGVLLLLSVAGLIFSREWVATAILLGLQTATAYTLGRLSRD